jgi:hypothetical protein
VDPLGGSNPCYVNPFVLHGYYARYLRPWAESYGGSKGHLFVVDFDALEADAGQVMAKLANFLGLRPFQFATASVFNSRKNPGVHRSRSKASRSTGGLISGVKKEDLGGLEDWADTRLSPEARDVLRRYFSRPNAELEALLDSIGEAGAMAWLR